MKYPAALVITLSAKPRPAPEVVVTDPAAGVRPVLPAGYGSGFEIGEGCCLHCVAAALPKGGS